MNKKILPLFSIMLVTMLLATTIAAAQIHPEVEVCGWAEVELEDEEEIEAEGRAELVLFTNLKDHCEKGLLVKLTVDGHTFWWVINPSKIYVGEKYAKMTADPLGGHEGIPGYYPYRIRIIVRHKGMFWTFVRGRGLKFFGRSNCWNWEEWDDDWDDEDNERDD